MTRLRRIALLPILAATLTGCGAASDFGAGVRDGLASSVAQPTATVAAVPVSPAAPPTALAASAPAAPSSWVMPNLVGANLQEAQDKIQALTGFGIAVTTSHDASGAGRQQVLDRNWTVCDQNIPAGRKITPESEIDFGAVKTTESC